MQTTIHGKRRPAEPRPRFLRLPQMFISAISIRLAAKTLAPLRAGSSRSHCIVILNVERLWPSGRTTHCRLLVCDLAGSERQKSVRPFLRPL